MRFDLGPPSVHQCFLKNGLEQAITAQIIDDAGTAGIGAT
jgi:hypothetical protein